jgi:hypothetical protein
MDTTQQIAAIHGIALGLSKIDPKFPPAVQRLTLLLPACPECKYKLKLSDEGYASEAADVEAALVAAEGALSFRAKSSVRAMFRHAMLCSAFMARQAIAAAVIHGTRHKSQPGRSRQ